MTVVATVPKTDAELFESYYSHIKFLVGRAGIVNVEDVGMILMEKIIAKGLLDQYNPGHESGANFKTFLSNFVVSFLRHYIEREAKERYRNPISNDMKVKMGNDESAGEGYYYLDLLVHEDADTGSVEASELVENVRKTLKDDPKLSTFFDFVMFQVEDYGKLEVAELADIFGVTRSTIHNWRNKLREVFAQCQ